MKYLKSILITASLVCASQFAVAAPQAPQYFPGNVLCEDFAVANRQMLISGGELLGANRAVVSVALGTPLSSPAEFTVRHGANKEVSYILLWEPPMSTNFVVETTLVVHPNGEMTATSVQNRRVISKMKCKRISDVLPNPAATFGN